MIVQSGGPRALAIQRHLVQVCLRELKWLRWRGWGLGVLAAQSGNMFAAGSRWRFPACGACMQCGSRWCSTVHVGLVFVCTGACWSSVTLSFIDHNNVLGACKCCGVSAVSAVWFVINNQLLYQVEADISMQCKGALVNQTNKGYEAITVYRIAKILNIFFS